MLLDVHCIVRCTAMDVACLQRAWYFKDAPEGHAIDIAGCVHEDGKIDVAVPPKYDTDG
jgi:hypothetical protein